MHDLYNWNIANTQPVYSNLHNISYHCLPFQASRFVIIKTIRIQESNTIFCVCQRNRFKLNCSMKKVQVPSYASSLLVPSVTQACNIQNFFILTEERKSSIKSRCAASVPTRRTRPQFFSSDVYATLYRAFF